MKAVKKIGDFNGRVGSKDDSVTYVVERHGEQDRNNSGKRLIECCEKLNTYNNKEIDKFTRQ